MSVNIFDSRNCTLGEGVLWHPQRQQLFWFDIIQKKLLSKRHDKPCEWLFDEYVSAAAWVDHNTLLIASESCLFTFDIENQQQRKICPLEADNSVTRSNDGRADPWGGFWIGTMGKKAEHNAGAIYRFYKGELRELYGSLTIPNAICFSPGRFYAYFADTRQRKIWRQKLNSNDGWPEGDVELFVDCAADGINPDGAVVDANGYLWNAQWGAGRVACYSPQGELIKTISLPAEQVTCPGFGGDQLDILYLTSADEGLTTLEVLACQAAGQTFSIRDVARGQPENQIQLFKG